MLCRIRTLTQWLIYWLETYRKPTAKPSGYARHRDICAGRIIPAIGDTPLDAVTTAQPQEFPDRQKAHGNLQNMGILLSLYTGSRLGEICTLRNASKTSENNSGGPGLPLAFGRNEQIITCDERKGLEISQQVTNLDPVGNACEFMSQPEFWASEALLRIDFIRD